MDSNNLAHLDTLLDMLAKGEFVEGMERFFDENVAIQEQDNPPRRGKANCIDFEKQLLTGVSEFIQYTAHSKAGNGDKTFYEATMEFKTTDGMHVVQNQCVVTTWKDGKIITERYYHNNA